MYNDDEVMLTMLLKSAMSESDLGDDVIARDKKYIKELTRRAELNNEDLKSYIKRYFKGDANNEING